MPRKKKQLVANEETLSRIFIQPENEKVRASLVKYMEQILFGLHDFLNEHVGITREASLKALSDCFTDSRISEQPATKLADVIRKIIDQIAPHAVNVASPYFIGHMTSAIPFFMVHLYAIMAALNQNTVKLETSKVVSMLERQVLAMIHRMVFNMEEGFYDEHIQKPDSTLGGFVEDGTLANMTALWVARNVLLHPKAGFKGVEQEGMAAAFAAYDIKRCVVLVSRLGHYSIRKAGGVLGLGNENIIPVDVDEENRIDLDKLKQALNHFGQTEEKTKVLAVIGIAGTTETGTVDPLPEIADICKKHRIHFHVDAAWGGPTLLSDKYKHLLKGIELADSVTIDGHKQFYMPMSCGMIYFKDPEIMDAIAYHAAYINRRGSVDMGIRSLVGSRAAKALVLKSALDIMGAKGYALLINHGIETARLFAEEIKKRELFDLTTAPRLNILTYRIFPSDIRKKWITADDDERKELTCQLNEITTNIQRIQRETGKSFVSRTTLKRPGKNNTVVFRSVIMNPMTDMEIINEILDEQEAIYHSISSG